MTENGFLSALTGLVPTLPAVSLAISGLFPLPSPYHSTLVLLLAGNLTPLIGGLALRRVSGTLATRYVLYLAFVLGIVVVGIVLGAGNLVTNENIGLWIRIWAAVTMPSYGFLCYMVWLRVPKT